jgi:hypothetical protein
MIYKAPKMSPGGNICYVNIVPGAHVAQKWGALVYELFNMELLEPFRNVWD